MPIKTSRQETINALNAIFEKHKNERVCVLATTCCGKTTLLRQIPGCVDLDDELWPQLTAEEAEYISQKPWMKEIGDYIDKLVYERITIKSGYPLFSTIILLIIEVLIALYVHDSFVRPYVGDMLVVLVVYAFVRIFIPEKVKLLPLWVFIFAVAVEILQWFHIVDILGFTDNRFFSVLIGGVFDVKDIFCYGVGCILLGGYEYLTRTKTLTKLSKD